MIDFKKTIPKSLINQAISLDSIGLNEVAWKKKDAQSLIACLSSIDICVLGGDVYQVLSESIVPTYDNWSCEKDINESYKQYFQRSQLEALSYINGYNQEEGKIIIFALVFTEFWHGSK